MSCWSELALLPLRPSSIEILEQTKVNHPDLNGEKILDKCKELEKHHDVIDRQLFEQYVAEDNLECFCYLVATRDYQDAPCTHIKLDYKSKIGKLLLSIPDQSRGWQDHYYLAGNDIIPAEYAGFHDMVDELIKKDKNYVLDAVTAAIYANNLERVSTLITEPIDNVVIEAARLGRTKILSYLLSIGCDADDCYDPALGTYTALNFAIVNGHYDCAIMLREHMSDKTFMLDISRFAKTITPHQYKFYVKLGFDADEFKTLCGMSFFTLVCSNLDLQTNAKMVEYFVENGYDVGSVQEGLTKDYTDGVKSVQNE